MKTGEKRLYLENSLSQQLIVLYIVGNTVFTILFVNNTAVNFHLGNFILLNIVLSLTAFLMAVRQKMYNISWGYVGIAFALFQLARILWIPEEIVNPLRLLLVGLLIVTSVSALVGSIICIKRAQERQKFITDNNVDLAILQK